MAEKDTNKKSIKISDDEIVKALRKAVLDSIGEPATRKKAIEKIDSTEDLSKELRTIGRKLVRKQNTRKKDSLVLSEKDIERIKSVAKTEDLEITSKKEQNVKPSKTKAVKAPRKESKKDSSKAPIKTQTSKKRGGIGFLRGVAPVQKMLPKPTFFDRVSISVSKWKLVSGLFIVLVILVLSIPIIFYKSSIESKFVNSIASALNLPIASVNGESIGFRTFAADVEALNNFFEDESNVTSYDISNLGEVPEESQIRDLVLKRHTRVLLIRQSLASLGESISEEDVQEQLNEIIRETGGEEELTKIVADLYSWTVDDFIIKALKPLLEEERLTIYVSTDQSLNSDKKSTIDQVATSIASGESFEDVARRESEDVTAEVGGNLDWFTRGTMVKAFEDQVLQLEVGDISEPFETNFGWHVVMLTDRETGDDGAERFKASHILVDYLTLNEYLSNIRETADIKNLKKL